MLILQDEFWREAGHGDIRRSSTCFGPAFEPDLWNRRNLVRTVNCFGYALNIPQWVRLRENKDCERRLAIDIALQRIETMGLIPAGDDMSDMIGHYLVALTWGPRARDWHWLRRDSNGKWSHKMGPNPVTNRDDAHRLIHDPRRAAIGNASEVVGYFYAPLDGARLHH
jgi:hypothetical protein